MKKRNENTKKWMVVLGMLCLTVVAAWGGDLNAPAGPADAGSAMFTLEDLYKRLVSGTAGAKRSGAFSEPGAAPAATMHSLNQIMEKAPVADNTNGAGAAQVLAGKNFWGLLSGGWGLQTGSMQNNGAISITPGTASQTIVVGYHNGSGQVGGDPNLVPNNITYGTSVFGVAGNLVGGVVLKAGGSFSSGKRWYDNADGTITDTRTGLVWMKTLPTTGRPYVATNPSYIDTPRYLYSLKNGVEGLADGSTNGDWRLPTLKEMQSLRTGPEAISSGNMQGFSGSQADSYWTCSPAAIDTHKMACINMATGASSGGQKYNPPYVFFLVWPVRTQFLP